MTSMNVPSPVHGGNIWAAAARLGCHPADILDFSANINPLGMPTGARRAAEAALAEQAHAYPDPRYTELREAASARYGVPPDAIVAGNGASELLDALCRLQPWRQAHILRPCYGEYAGAAARAQLPVAATDAFIPFTTGAELTELPVGFPDPLPAGTVLFVGHPNNPTGTLISPALLAELAERCAKAQGLLVVDRSFLAFSPNEGTYSATGLIKAGLPVVEVISLTKIYAMPGLRLGIAVAQPELAQRLMGLLPPWSVNAVAAAAGAAALQDQAFLEQTRALVTSWRSHLIQVLATQGWSCAFPAAANFVLMSPGARSGPELARLLEMHKILVRCTASFAPLDDRYLRLAVRPLNEQAKLLAALAEITQQGV